MQLYRRLRMRSPISRSIQERSERGKSHCESAVYRITKLAAASLAQYVITQQATAQGVLENMFAVFEHGCFIKWQGAQVADGRQCKFRPVSESD